MVHFDALDRRILTLLQEDATLTIRDIARRVHLTSAPVMRRIQRLNEQGVIRQRVALLDRVALGLNVQAFAFVTLENHRVASAAQFEQAIVKVPEVLECLRLSGEHDFMLRVVVASMADYSKFLDTSLLPLPAVRSVSTSFELGVLKSTTALPFPDADTERRARSRAAAARS